MAAFTAKDVQALRERTGCGMMDCKKALVDADGDMDKAVDILREKGLAKVAKKAGRIAAEGAVVTYVDQAAKVGVVIEVNAETDFVAKNESFQAFVQNAAQTVAKQSPADVDALLACTMENGQTVQESLNEKIQTIGENIKVRRFERYEGIVATYVHGGGRIGVMVKFDTTDAIADTDAFKAMAKDVAMQVAAANPSYLDEASVPAEVLEKEKHILTEQVLAEGKPAQIAEKIVMGKLGKYYKENCLVDQAFIKDGDLSVQKFVQNTAKDLGGEIKIVSFVRFEKGEGLQKREDNFADEVAGMIK